MRIPRRAPAVRRSRLVPRDGPPRSPSDAATRAAFIARQRRQGHRVRRVRRWLRGLGTALTVVLVLAAIGVTGAAAAHALRRSGLLAVTDLSIAGARRIPEATVRAAAGISEGADILTVDPEAVVDRLEAVPGIRRAQVVRHLPNRVAITVEEREPYALVNLNRPDREAGLVWVDAYGHLVGPERHGVASALPILSGVEPPPATPGEPVGDRLRAGLGLLRAVQRSGARATGRISEIDLEPGDGPVLYLIDGVTVWLGSEGWDERLARLDAVVDRLTDQAESVESLDFRFRDQVVLRPRRVSAAAQKGR